MCFVRGAGVDHARYYPDLSTYCTSSLAMSLMPVGSFRLLHFFLHNKLTPLT